jgi:hypothetical protein
MVSFEMNDMKSTNIILTIILNSNFALILQNSSKTLAMRF